ncbi:hypothetical protein Ahy_A01g004607 [Arachis hypogaea]|uniref:PB1-like domain-containing protein n=1 Tax=Arachis hypogaea TaxID=3818 RepID=A0A445EWK2_ARAHY|nr:hypothetical protein Ahy_A01g004607 [Arachis hypogaea]
MDLAPNEEVNDVVHTEGALENGLPSAYLFEHYHTSSPLLHAQSSSSRSLINDSELGSSSPSPQLPQMDVLLDIMFHHGGNFEKDDEGNLRYTPDNVTCLGDLDEDTLDVFFIRNYYKELGYDKILQCWWLVPGRKLETGLRNLKSDDELREMCFLAQKNNGLVDVYFEHGVSSPDYLEDQQEKAGMDNTGVVLAEEEGAVPNDKERNLSTESPQNKPIPVNTVDTPIHPTPPINPTPPTMPEFLTNPNSPSQEIPLANSNDQSQAKPPTNEKPKPFTNPQPKPRTNQKAKPSTPPQPKPPTNQKPKLSTNPQPKPPTNQNPKPPTNSRPCTRSVAKGKTVLQARQKGGDALSSDSYDSDEDSDTGYEKFEVHGYPANHVVDLGKYLCTCQFWMLTVEVELSQPIYSEPEESQQAAEVCTITNSRPDKLPPKRKSSISPTSANAPINPMQGASSGTATRLGSILKFIPTSGFKAPRKKD